jgi:hypothetical protein
VVRSAPDVIVGASGEIPFGVELLAGVESAGNRQESVLLPVLEFRNCWPYTTVSVFSALSMIVAASPRVRFAADVERCGQVVEQADLLGQSQGVDGPGSAFEAFGLGVIAEDDEDHLQELDAGELGVRGEQFSLPTPAMMPAL